MSKEVKIDVNSHKDDFLKEFDRKREMVLEEIGLIAERYAKDGAHVDTGRMRNSITHATSRYSGVGSYRDDKGNKYADASAKSTPEEDAVYIGTNVEYAPYVELGTSRNDAYPFLRPAVQNHIKEFQDLIRETMKK